MSKKMLIICLLITAVVSSTVLPPSVFGETVDFKPRNQTYWTGSAQATLDPSLLLTYSRLSGGIMAGFKQDNPLAQANWWRGFVMFDISSLPADACVSGIELIGYSLTSTSGHNLEIRRMTIDPSATTGEVLFNGVAGELYANCSSCMSSGGNKSVTLPSSSYPHLESDQAQGWFALGLTEKDENNLPGMWDGQPGMAPPILRVTYTIPPRAIPIPVIAVDSVCTGEQFCVSWNPVPGATSYLIRETGGFFVNVGSVTSTCFTKNTAGNYSFNVRALNSCGMSGTSPGVSIQVITPPAQPTIPVASPGPYCLNVGYTISWNPLSGVSSYEIREDNNSWINVGNVTQWTFRPNVAGNHSYVVRGVNMCGAGNSSSAVSVNVPANLVAPAQPVASGGPYCAKVNYTISWPTLPGADTYEIQEGRLAWISTGNKTKWIFNHSLAGSYSYKVRGVNVCGPGRASTVVTVTVQAAPVAPTPVISVDSVCSGNQFCVTWNSVPGATAYEIRQGTQPWTSTQSVTSKCYIKWGVGNYSYSVRAINDCGASIASQSVAVNVLNVLAAPAQPVASTESPCTNFDYTISWTPLVGAEAYEIQEDNGSWIGVGNASQWSYNHSSVGTHRYSVRGFNMCGPTSPSPPVSVTVQTTTTAVPDTPRASNVTPCPDEIVSIRWAAIEGATEYKLSDFTNEEVVYTGPDLEWRGRHSSGSYEYRLSVSSNDCGWSNASEPLTIKVKPQLTAPGSPVSDQNPAIVDEPYTISWEAVPGATYYELYEDKTVLIYTGAELQTSITRRIGGDFTYSVKACDECGCSNMGNKLALTVDTPTDVEEISMLALPDDYALSQNYPNPFNPETRIEFSLKRSGYVELTVYNVLGGTVRSLVTDYLSAGYKAVTWDGRDNSGRQVSSGIYLYKLTTGEYTETKKMMLIK